MELLRKNIGQPVSGEEMSQKLSISRTAIWKHIQNLKHSGYDIRAVYKKGYTLYSSPDLLLPNEILTKLTTKSLGRNIIYQTSVDSTNNIAKKAAFDGCEHGTIVVAEEQVGGKGRLARGWFSPLGRGIWFSLVLRPPFLPQEAPKFTLLMAVALAQAFEKYPEVKIAIKWPNDILLNERKLVGILTEMNAEMEAINYIVIGTGINVNVPKDIAPQDIQDKLVSLADVCSNAIDRVKLLTVILKELEELYEKVLQEGFSFVLDRWREYSVTLGSKVKVIAPGETFVGLAKDIDESGALVVEKDDGTSQKVLAGDVSIRAAHSDKYI